MNNLHRRPLFIDLTLHDSSFVKENYAAVNPEAIASMSEIRAPNGTEYTILYMANGHTMHVREDITAIFMKIYDSFKDEE